MYFENRLSQFTLKFFYSVSTLDGKFPFVSWTISRSSHQTVFVSASSFDALRLENLICSQFVPIFVDERSSKSSIPHRRLNSYNWIFTRKFLLSLSCNVFFSNLDRVFSNLIWKNVFGFKLQRKLFFIMFDWKILQGFVEKLNEKKVQQHICSCFNLFFIAQQIAKQWSSAQERMFRVMVQLGMLKYFRFNFLLSKSSRSVLRNPKPFIL